MEEVNGKWSAFDVSGTGFHKCEAVKNQTGTKKVETPGNFADANGQPTMYTLYERMGKILAEITDIKERLK